MGIILLQLCVWAHVKTIMKDLQICLNHYMYPGFYSPKSNRMKNNIVSIRTYLSILGPTWATWAEKAMASHSSTRAWKIPWTEEPGRLQSMGSLRVRHDWATSLWLFTFMHRRKKWQPTPVFLPGESQGQRTLVGCRLWGRTESDTTEAP